MELERGNERNSVILQLGNLIRDITRNTAVIIKDKIESSINSEQQSFIADTVSEIRLIVSNAVRGKIEVFLRERESESNELNKKVQRLRSLEQEWTYEAICDEIVDSIASKLDATTAESPIVPSFATIELIKFLYCWHCLDIDL